MSCYYPVDSAQLLTTKITIKLVDLPGVMMKYLVLKTGLRSLELGMWHTGKRLGSGPPWAQSQSAL